MLILIFLSIFLLLVIYTVIPDIWFRFISPSVLKRGNKSRRYVFFTFDDGPHPIYTTQILEILERNNIKATFFFLGKKAKEFPEIVRLVKEKGHVIGSHGYSHRPIWVLYPNATREEFKKTDSIIYSILGEFPKYIRPPWGGFNLSMLKFLNDQKKRFVLWSLDSRDWQRNIGVDNIIERVLNRIEPGDIVLFHDGRWEDISKKTVEALPIIIEKLRLKGYEISLLSEDSIHGERKFLTLLLKAIFTIVDVIFYRVTKTIRIDDPEMLLSFSINRNRWKRIILKDGTIIDRGDRYVEIHFLNDAISSILRNHQTLMGASKEIKRRLFYSIERIIKYLEDNGLSDVKAFHGVTVLYRIIGTDLGTIYDVNPIFRSFVDLYEKLILVTYHPEGFNRLKKKGKLTPKSIWVSTTSIRDLVTRHRNRIISKGLI
ncbi:MAG: polysaccharide deacetylase family protein [bacterium]|nr:polysaccharide deacetylase family protein [bacterium]